MIGSTNRKVVKKETSRQSTSSPAAVINCYRHSTSLDTQTLLPVKQSPTMAIPVSLAWVQHSIDKHSEQFSIVIRCTISNFKTMVFLKLQAIGRLVHFILLVIVCNRNVLFYSYSPIYIIFQKLEDANYELNFAARVEFADNIPQISGGGLSGTYQFLQYHVHWGTSDSAGSEHQIDGQQWVRKLKLNKFLSMWNVGVSTEVFWSRTMPSF